MREGFGELKLTESCIGKRHSRSSPLSPLTPGEVTPKGKSESFDKTSGVAQSKATAKTPFGINRHFVLFFYCLYCLATGCCYWGWDGMVDMLYKSEAFLTNCIDASDRVDVNGQIYPTCKERRGAIGNLYTTAFVCHFGFSAVAGFILDMAGGKICSFVGLAFTATGWIMLAIAGPSTQGVYYAGTALIGAGADTGNLPILSVANLYPGSESLILSILGSVRSLSFAVPVIMSKIYTGSDDYTAASFSNFCYGYVGVGVGMACVICALFIPWRPFKGLPKTEVKSEKREVSARAKSLSVTGEEQETSALTLERKDKKTGSFSDVPSSCVVETGSPIVQQESFLSNFRKPEFLLIVPFFSLCLIRGEFYGKSVKEMLVTSGKHNIYSLFTIFNILSFLPGPVFRKLCDKIGVLWVILILNIDGIFVYFFALWDSYPCKVLSVLFYFIYGSFVLSNLYCYVAATFPAEHFGKLTGVASFAAGMFTVNSLWIYNISLGPTFANLGAYAFAPACGLMICFAFINMGLWGCMKGLEKRKAARRVRHDHEMQELESKPLESLAN